MDQLLEGQKLLNTWPLCDVVKMGYAVAEAGHVDLELSRAPLTPEEVRIRRGEMVEENFSACPSRKSYPSISVV
ncbi:MAG: hypothetical protein ACREHV_16010 [Rhizomicrobium sp.]